MKQFIAFLCLVTLSAGLNSCSKSSDPDPVVVGTWKLDRIRSSGFVAPYTSLNGDNDPLSVFGVQDNFTIKNDKTYTGTFRSNGTISDYNGNWDLSSNTLTLKDTQGNSDVYTLDETKTPTQLLGAVINTSDSLTNPSTQRPELVRYTLQLVYTKQ